MSVAALESAWCYKSYSEAYVGETSATSEFATFIPLLPYMCSNNGSDHSTIFVDPVDSDISC